MQGNAKSLVLLAPHSFVRNDFLDLVQDWHFYIRKTSKIDQTGY
jgi:hypothetical protein